MFHLVGVGAAVNEDVLHAGMREEFERVFNEGGVGQWEETLRGACKDESEARDGGGRGLSLTRGFSRVKGENLRS